MVSDRPLDDGEESSRPSRRRVLSTIATAGAAGLAGCSFDEDEEEEGDPFTATPVVLGPEGQEVLGLTAFEIEEQVETVTPSEEYGEVETTSYLAVHGRPGEHEPPLRFDVPDPAARTAGALSMPSPEGIGEKLNPLASEPLGELLVGKQGRQLLARSDVVDTPHFDWQRRPKRIGTQEVEMLGEAAEAQSFLGVAVGEGPVKTIVATLARTHHEGDTVLFGEFNWRRTPSDPIEVDGPCIDELCQLPDPAEVDMWRRFKEAIENLSLCEEVPHEGNLVEICTTPGSGSGSGESSPPPKFGITNARFVQQVDNTTVEAPGSSPIHTEPNPDLVRGENTTVLFEFDQLENLDEMDEPLEITVYRGDAGVGNGFHHSDKFEIPISELKKIESGSEHTTTVLHRLANDSSTDNDLPVFEMEDSVAVVTASNVLRYDFWERVTEHPKNIVDLEPLKVGFVALADDEDASRYGNSNGFPRDVGRTFESATEYLQRVYPGDVVSFGYMERAIVGGEEETGLFVSNCTGSCVVYRDMKRAKNYLNRVATDSSFPSNAQGFPDGGRLRLDGLDRSTMVNEIRSSGFDVVVAIVPGVATNNSGTSDYYDYHGISASGLAFDDPAAAVSTEGASSSGGDQRVSTTVAQEIGHYYQDDYWEPTPDSPMAQRRDPDGETNIASGNGDLIDPAHARHQNSTDASGNADPEGVVSLAFDLTDGFDNVQEFENPNGSFSVDGPSAGASSIGKLESYMSYTPRDDEAWADAKIHQQLIDSGWSASGTSGSNSARFMLSAVGGFTEEGTVGYDDVTAMPGVDEYTDLDDGPIQVELLGPNGNVLATARIPAVIHPSHHGGMHEAEPARIASFALPFDDRGVRVRTTHEERPAFMNPIVRSVRDAVRRVPEEGVRGDPKEARAAIGEPLDDVAALMEERAYGKAAAIMGEVVRERIQERIGEYEGALNEPTRAELLDLVDEMARRLRVIAEVSE